MKSFLSKSSGLCALFVLGAVALTAPALAQTKPGKNGTTLAASKTIDICEIGNGQWRYSGQISVWNEGAVATSGLTIQDCIQNKTSSGQFADVASLCTTFPAGTEIAAGTTLQTATTFPYSIEGYPLSGDIRNIARVKILNHSGSLGTATGPEPKATWLGGDMPPPCNNVTGCVLTQGYWGTHHDWPTPYSPGDTFFTSDQTWQQVLDTPAQGSGYYILAYQFIAATLNQAKGASVPSGIADTLALADGFFSSGATPASCTSANSKCGLQKTWGATLDVYNNGDYEGGPPHCE